jgi:hypothetical protein
MNIYIHTGELSIHYLISFLSQLAKAQQTKPYGTSNADVWWISGSEVLLRRSHIWQRGILTPASIAVAAAVILNHDIGAVSSSTGRCITQCSCIKSTNVHSESLNRTGKSQT